MGEEWLEVDLNEEFTILGVGTKGDENIGGYVQTYSLQVKSGESGASWEYVKDKQGKPQVRRIFLSRK